MKNFNPYKSEALPNGARIILFRRARMGDLWVWFCYYDGLAPYVTWLSREDNPGATFSGRYHKHFGRAYTDFCNRLNNS